MKKRRALTTVVGVVLGLVLVWFLWFNRREKDRPQYRMARTERGSITAAVTASATVNPLITVQVGSQVSGIVARLFADFNGQVRAGQVIAQLDPTFLQAAVNVSRASLGRAEANLKDAERKLKRAQELDPLSLIVNAIIGGWFYYYARDYDKGIEQCQRVLEMDPEFRPAHQFLWWNHAGKKMYGEALKEAQKTNYQWAIANIYAMMSRPGEARRMLSSLFQYPGQYEIGIARIYFQLGESAEGWKWFDKAYDERAYGLIYIKIDPSYDNIRSDPRFQALLKKVGLE